MPKEDELLKLWLLERKLDGAREAKDWDREHEIEFEIEELMNEVPANGNRCRGNGG